MHLTRIITPLLRLKLSEYYPTIGAETILYNRIINTLIRFRIQYRELLQHLIELDYLILQGGFDYLRPKLHFSFRDKQTVKQAIRQITKADEYGFFSRIEALVHTGTSYPSATTTPTATN